MKHYGDITKLSGYTLPIVDVITGGSPCQDLSVAGKRAGLSGERSGLFMEQVRIVKEMRARDVQESGRAGQYVRPRYMVWENVPGAFSSNGGRDFQAVLSEIAKIAEPDAADVPMPEKGKWPNAGCVYDDLGCWSIAWRVHDAQFWGVPQRRKRISLVADFGGLSAPEILFERKGLSRDPEPGEAKRQGLAGTAGSGAGSAISFQERAGKPGGGKGILIQHEHVGALSTLNNQSVLAYGVDQQGGKGGANYTEDVCPPILSDSHGTPHAVAYGISSYDSNAMKSPNPRSGIYEADTARTLDLNGGSPACNQGGIAVVQSVEPILLESNQNHATVQIDGISTTLPASMGMGGGYVPMVTTFTQNQRDEVRDLGDVAGALAAEPGMKQQTFVCAGFKAGQSMAGGIGWAEEQAATLSANCSGTEPTVYDARNFVLCAGFDGSMGAKAGNIGYEQEMSPTLNSGKEMHVYDARGNGNGVTVPTLTGDHQNRVTDYTALCVGNGQMNQISMAEQANTLDTMHDCQAIMIAAVDCQNFVEDADTNGTLQSSAGHNLNSNNVCRTESVVRRLTPKECERLQGFPDGWTDIGEWTDSKGKKHKDADSPRYKALGNSIALPFWQWMARRICAMYERNITMASLFDGIGGFPLVFQRCGATPVWASEIEEFPIAVTKKHFPEVDAC